MIFKQTEEIQEPKPLSLRKIFHTWWPLSASRLMMGLGLPLLSAFVARLPDPEIQLAAYGGIVSPITLFIASPLTMLLSASTALSKDWSSYARLRRFLFIGGTILTGIHILIAFTPLYYFIVSKVISAPAEIIEPARIGLMISTPWTFAVGYRRFQQGVMIRFGHSDAVGVGTVTRITTNVIILVIGFMLKSVPGVVVGAAAQTTGLVCEALYTGWRVRPILKYELKSTAQAERLGWRGFANFYIPLALTTMVLMLWQPIGTAAISRMPNPLISLAIWPVLNGARSIFRSFGMAYNEVVVALLDRKRSFLNLKKFTWYLSTATTILFVVFAASPLAHLYFGKVSALPQNLAVIAVSAFWLVLPMPVLSVLRSWFQGAILVSKKTGGIPESVVISLVGFIAIMAAGIAWKKIDGVYVAIAGLVIGTLGQTLWLWFRSRPYARKVQRREHSLISTQAD